MKSLGIAIGYGLQLESSKDDIWEKTSSMFQYYLWERMQEIEEGIPYILPLVDVDLNE